MKTKEKLIAGLLTALFVPIGVGYIALCKKNEQIEDLTNALTSERDLSKQFIDKYTKLGDKTFKLTTENARLKQKLKDLEGRK